jgi:hypothetical protein
MRSFKQVVLLIIILIGLIGGITFVAHFRGTAPKSPTSTSSPAPRSGDN